MTTLDVCWKIGGQAGDGIDTTGEIFASAAARFGLYLFTHRNFSSRIRGGYTSYEARMDRFRVMARKDNFDMLVALDQETLDRDATDMRENGLVLYDSTTFKPVLPEGTPKVRFYGLPLTQAAREHGGEIMRNVVAVGASTYLLGMPEECVMDVVRKIFARKGEAVVAQNREALEAGMKLAREQIGPQEDLVIDPGDYPKVKTTYLVTGNEAVGLGALAGGCRFIAGYPITPATTILEYLISKMKQVGGVGIQVEDEIAAVHMAIGAAYAGVRAMTSTSGPGLSLMTEGLSLAGAIEVPLVVVDVQRSGPSTGLPTKHEQSDVNHALFGGHGESPRIVLAPGTVEDCFYQTVDAFNLADKYQCPVFILIDEELGMCKQTVEGLDFSTVHIDRGEIVPPEGLSGDRQFARYKITPTGISPRVIPGTPGGSHVESGAEHNEDGRIIETPRLRTRMMDKRMVKMTHALHDLPEPALFGDPRPDVMIVGFGSTTGPALETLARVNTNGTTISYLQLRALWPLQGDHFRHYLAPAKKVLVAESNATGQLTRLIKSEVPFENRVQSLLKYDGRPFRPSEIVAAVRRLS